jgi:hypothetical protein
MLHLLHMLQIHILSVLFSIFFIVKSDHRGIQWWRGTRATLNVRELSRLHSYVTLGLILLIATGAYLFYPMSEYLLQTNIFWVKMSFVAALVINSFVIGTLMNIASKKKYTDLSAREKYPLFISGGISSLSWIGAIVAGFFLV